MLQKLVASVFALIGFISTKWSAKLAIELLFRPRRKKRTPRENKFWLSGQPVEFASGCKGRIFGEGDKTTWVIHGWESRGSKMRGVIEACLKAGHRVVAWEGPAHGDSPGNRSNLALSGRTLAKDVASFGPTPDAIVGHSFGAASAAYACKLGLSIERLVFISGPSSSIGFFKTYWEMIGLKQAAQNQFVDLVEEELQVKLEDMSADQFIQTMNQKVMVIHDENDKLIPVADAKRLKSLRDDIELVLTEGQGHHRILKSREVMSQVAQFVGA